MARILERKLLSPAREYRSDSLCKRGSFLATELYCGVTDLEVIDVLVNVSNSFVGSGKLPPGSVDENDGARFVDDGYVSGEAI